MKKTSQYSIVTNIQGSFTGMKYYIIRYADSPFSLYYTSKINTAVRHYCPDEFETKEECVKRVETRESFISADHSVMW